MEEYEKEAIIHLKNMLINGKAKCGKLIFAILAMLTTNIVYSQVDNQDPSTWPKPTMENITEDGFFDSKEKLLVYYKWYEKFRAENLPNLYLLKKDKIELEGYLKPNFYLEEIASNRNRTMSFDSLQYITFTSIEDVKKSILNSSNPCEVLSEMFYEIILIDSSEAKTNVAKYNCTNTDVLENDDLTQYKVERKGDTLEIKFDYD